MKKFLLLTAIIAFNMLSFTSDNQVGVRFVSENWKDVQKIAKVKQKPIFIFVAGAYCHLSKELLTDVFSKKEVGDYLNRQFVCMKMDPQPMSNHLRLSNWGITNVPSMIYLAPDGKRIVYKSSGFKFEKALISEAQLALGILNKDLQGNSNLTLKTE